MPTKAKSTPAPSAPLGDIVTAFVQELARASVAADLSRARMGTIYEQHSLLKHYEPSRIKMVTVKVTLPIAYEGQTPGPPIDPGLSKTQVAALVGEGVSRALRAKIAEKVVAGLGAQNRFSNSRLAELARKIASTLADKEFAPERQFDAGKIRDLQKEWSSGPERAQEARFLYRAEDLEKLSPDRITKVDLTLDVS